MKTNNIKIGFESLKDKSIKELQEITKQLKELTGEDAEFNFNDLDNQEDFKGYTYAEYLEEQYRDELIKIKEKGLSNNQKVRELNKIPYAERLISGLK